MFAGVAGAGGSPPWHKKTIKIGEINSYSGLPAFTEPCPGWQLALRRGRTRRSRRQEARRSFQRTMAASRRRARDRGETPCARSDAGGNLLLEHRAGVSISPSKKILFLAAEPLIDAITWSKGNRYTFRLRPANYEQAAMLAEQAAKLPAKKWATIAPNYEYGQSAVGVSRRLLLGETARHRMGRRAIGRPQGKIDTGAGNRED